MTRVSIIGSGPMTISAQVLHGAPMEKEGYRSLDEGDVILVDAEDRPVGSAGKLIAQSLQVAVRRRKPRCAC